MKVEPDVQVYVSTNTSDSASIGKDDIVGVLFVKTKTNQEGSGQCDPRHLYANPLSPS
ncbi:hypothetical protein L917_17661, partial [Phytophthora nicotianae]